MEDQPADAVRQIYVLDRHEIYRRGLESVLGTLAGVDGVHGAASVAAAEEDQRTLGRSCLVMIDAALAGAVGFIARTVSAKQRPVLAYTEQCEHGLIRAVLEAGAIGLLARDAMTPEVLAAALQAALAGSCVFSPELLPRMLADAPDPPVAPAPSRADAKSQPAAEPRPDGTPSASGSQDRPTAVVVVQDPRSPAPPPSAPPRHGRLTTREQAVLRLIAQGHATREVASELCYSERTIKNVIHDAVTKLDARSRSHAVAHAVRHGLI
jgi:DNA-binding NarL/FixJ family response regulator